MSYFLLILLAIIPGLGICYLIYRLDKYEKEDLLPLAICFGLGVASAFPALKLEEWWDSIGVNEHGSFWMLLLLSFVVIALSEELVKFIALIAYPFQKKFFNEPLDGVVYAVMIGMGFATLENILYADRFGTGTTIVRAFTAVPAHAIFAVLMGYYVGKAKFDKENRIKNLAIGLGVAIGVHGIYDVFILQQYHEWLMLLATLTLIIGGYFAYRLIQKHLSDSPFNQESIDTLDQVETEIDDSALIADGLDDISPDSEDNEIMDAILKELNEEE